MYNIRSFSKIDVFQSNPIQNDEDVKKKVERYERARIVIFNYNVIGKKTL